MYGLINGIDTNFVDCNAPMYRFFRRLGYKKVAKKAHEKFRRVYIMKLNLRDKVSLKASNSYFLDILENKMRDESIYA